ncbi:MAG: tRNA glutamyl-Q(34) synthetase GluQRS, partial [Gammaproteobacteria bacterium]|nr:tRNA glutamyl-Q(34) synthetase GluQRS [Gammaproteobacteria bacterium]
MSRPDTTRFAPSPTGRLHLGHAFAAFVAHDLARARGGLFRLRLEDLDAGRCRPVFAEAILADLRWLELAWDGDVWQQSARLPVYRQALATLASLNLLYPCFCTRGAIAAEVGRMAEAPQGPDGPLYPGTCRHLDPATRTLRLASGDTHALRLDVARSLALLDVDELVFTETGAGPAGERGLIRVPAAALGDPVLGRKDVGVSYHLACVVDDAAQGVTLVSRGEDLFAAAGIQRLLQALLGLPAPRYHHHRLIRDAHGRRLAKRDQ